MITRRWFKKRKNTKIQEEKSCLTRAIIFDFELWQIHNFRFFEVSGIEDILVCRITAELVGFLPCHSLCCIKKENHHFQDFLLLFCSSRIVRLPASSVSRENNLARLLRLMMIIIAYVYGRISFAKARCNGYFGLEISEF